MKTVTQRSPDEEVFLRLFMRKKRALLRFILRYLPALNDARDVLQETLVTVWSKRSEFDETKEFLPWACGIARFSNRTKLDCDPAHWQQLVTEMRLPANTEFLVVRLYINQLFESGGAYVFTGSYADDVRVTLSSHPPQA